MTRACAVSDKGPFRKGNEDAFVCDGEFQLFAVADGMGGHSAGEIASRLAIEAIVGFVRRSADGDELSWPHAIDPSLSFDGNRLRTAIYLANRRVFRAAEEHDDYAGMGTTAVGALIADSKIIVGHVGDSRMYMLKGGTLRRLTKDDSWAATILTDELVGGAAAIANHPLRNALTNVLGAREETDIHMAELPLQGGEVLLLCTDGLHGVLGDDAIQQILEADEDIARTAQSLIDAALAAGTRDNLTALVVHCDEVPA